MSLCYQQLLEMRTLGTSTKISRIAEGLICANAHAKCSSLITGITFSLKSPLLIVESYLKVLVALVLANEQASDKSEPTNPCDADANFVIIPSEILGLYDISKRYRISTLASASGTGISIS